MTKLTKKIHNAETGEETIVELTATEIAELELEALAAEQVKTEALARLASKEAALVKLGLTQEEAASLLA